MPNAALRKARKKRRVAANDAAPRPNPLEAICTDERLAKGDVTVAELPVVGQVAFANDPCLIERMHRDGRLDEADFRTALSLKEAYHDSRQGDRVSGGYSPGVKAGWADTRIEGDERAEMMVNRAMRAAGQIGSAAIVHIVFLDMAPRAGQVDDLRAGLACVRRQWRGG